MQIDDYLQPRGVGFSVPRRDSRRRLGVEMSLDAARTSARATTSCLGRLLPTWPCLRRAALAVQYLASEVILRVIPIVRTGTPPALFVNFMLFVLTIVGLLLSVW